MEFLITALHVGVCLALIMIVLLQTGKGADIGASMGGAGGQTLFGTSGATTLLSKVTTGIAILFMVTSLILAYQSGKMKDSSIMDVSVPAVEETIPADTPPAAPAETTESVPADTTSGSDSESTQ